MSEHGQQATPLLQIEGLSKHFGETSAVDTIDLSVERGELFALLGGSGSGKSTLLRMLAGFEAPSGGRILLEGRDIGALPPYQRPINMMFQSYALFPHMSVAQNIAFGLKQDRLPKAEIAARVDALLELVQMSGYAGRKPHQLSGGQRQRVALARSLAKRPKLLLLDEPMGALDKKLRSKMQLEVVDILEEVGVTCIMVTHDQEEAMTMASRIAVMHEGRIAQVGTPIDIYEAPNSRLTAEFIGSVNLFGGSILVDENDHCVIGSTDLEEPIYIGHGISAPLESTEVWVAVRPEKTLISRERPAQRYNWTRGVVVDIAYLGTHSVYHVELPSGKRLQCNRANTERSADRPTWEDEVFLSWEDSSALVLNR